MAPNLKTSRHLNFRIGIGVSPNTCNPQVSKHILRLHKKFSILNQLNPTNKENPMKGKTFLSILLAHVVAGHFFRFTRGEDTIVAPGN